MRPFLLFAMSLAVTACTTSEAVDDESVTPDPVDGDYACLGANPLPAATSEIVEVSGRIFRYLALEDTGVAGASIMAYTAGGLLTAQTTTDANGDFGLTLPAGTHGFDGTLRTTADGYWPYIDHFAALPLAVSATWRSGLTTDEAVTALAGVFNELDPEHPVTIDPALGIAIVRVKDCALADVSGATVDLDASYGARAPISDAYVVDPRSEVTLSTGEMVFVNVAPGEIVATARGVVDGDDTESILGTAHLTVNAGTMSWSAIRPE